VCILVYSILHVIYIQRKDVFTTDGDEVQYLVVTESLVTDHDLSPLNNYLDHVYIKHGYYQQPVQVPPLVPGSGGRLVSVNTRFPFLLAPGFWLFKYQGAAATMILLSSLAAMFLFLALRKLFRETTALLLTLVFFLSYPFVMYSRLVYPETAAVFLLSLAIWASLRLKESGKWAYALLAGACAALMFQIHMKFVLISVALFVLLWACSPRKKRDVVAWGAPVVFSAAALLLITWYLFGPNLWHGLTAGARSSDVLGGTPFWGIFGLYLDRAWGLFIFAPLYFAFVPGIPLLRGRRDLTGWWLFIPACIVLHTLAMGFFGQWHGGVSPVPRYLVPLIPLFVICAAILYERCKNTIVRAFLALLLAFQVVLTVFALIYPMSVFAIHETANALIPKVLGRTWLARAVVRLFPLLHPVQLKSLLELVAWLFVLAAISLYLRRRLMEPIYPYLEIKETR